MRRELFCVVKMGGLTRMGAALYAPGQEGMGVYTLSAKVKIKLHSLNNSLALLEKRDTT